MVALCAMGFSAGLGVAMLAMSVAGTYRLVRRGLDEI